MNLYSSIVVVLPSLQNSLCALWSNNDSTTSEGSEGVGLGINGVMESALCQGIRLNLEILQSSQK